jgi:hypothetical protein
MGFEISRACFALLRKYTPSCTGKACQYLFRQYGIAAKSTGKDLGDGPSWKSCDCQSKLEWLAFT